MQSQITEAGKNNKSSWIFYGIGVLALCYYTWTIAQLALNIPKWDDFPEILQFIDRWLDAESPWEKLSVFISHTNEHILLVNHAIVLLQYAIIGHIDFAWLIYIGNAFYIGSALTLWLFFKSHSERAFIFCLLILTGVNFYPYDSMLWAMTAISNQAVICFSLAAIYTLTRSNINLQRVMLFTALAVFSQSNGLILLAVIGAHLYLGQKSSLLKPWLIFSIIIIALYLYGSIAGANPEETTVAHVMAGGLTQIPPINYFLVPVSLIAYFGAQPFSEASVINLLMALLLGTSIGVFSYKQINKKSYPDYYLLILAFMALSIVIIIAFRGIAQGPSVVFVSRYKMYGAYFLVTALLVSPWALDKITQAKSWRYSILGLALLLHIWSYPLNMAHSRLIDGHLHDSLQLWVEDGDLRRARGFFVHDADSYLFAALENETYTPLVLIPAEQILGAPIKLTECPSFDAATLEKKNYAVITHRNPNAAGIRVDIQQPDTLLTLCAENQFYQLRIPMHKHSAADGVYFVAREHIAPGSYRVFVTEGNKTWLQESLFINKKNTR